MDIEKHITTFRESTENDADVIIVNGETFTFKSSGLTRRVFVNHDKTKVVKVMVSKDYTHYNKEEKAIWDKADDNKRKQLASTEILDNGFIIQEFLHTLDDETTSEWLGRPLSMKEVRFAGSCRNDVGFDKDGNLKCFDLEEFKKY